MEALGALAGNAAQFSPFNQGIGMLRGMGNSAFDNYLHNQNLDRREKAFTDSGLPKFMAYMGNASNLPQQRIQLAGRNFQNAGPVGTTPFTSYDPYVRRMGFGFPGPLGGDSQNSQQNSLNSAGFGAARSPQPFSSDASSQTTLQTSDSSVGTDDPSFQDMGTQTPFAGINGRQSRGLPPPPLRRF